MDMISDTGAITDINEIAAGVMSELPVEETARIEGLSMEELMTELSSTLDEVSSIPEEITDELGMTPAFESLVNVITEIQNSGSISRADAATISNMTTSLEGFENTFKNLPLISYTEMPSKVNFDASMENFLVNAAKKVIEIIKRMIAVVREKVKSFFKDFGPQKIQLFKVKEANKKTSASMRKDSQLSDTHVTIKSNALIQLLGVSGLVTPLGSAVRKATDAAGQTLTEATIPGVLEKVAAVYKLLAPDNAPEFVVSSRVTKEHTAAIYLAIAFMRKQAEISVNIDVADPVKWKSSMIDKFDAVLAKEFLSESGAAGNNLHKQIMEVDSSIRAQAFLNNYNHAGDNPEYTKAVNCSEMTNIVIALNVIFREIMKCNIYLLRLDVSVKAA